MARTAKPARTTKAQAPITKRPGRPLGSKNKVTAAAKASAVPARRAAAPKRVPAAAISRPPAVSKDDLRAQVEKLERANAMLRTKSREAGRTAREATARIEELEAQVTKLERSAVPKEGAVRTRGARSEAVTLDPKPTRSTRGRKPLGKRKPGRAKPLGVAVQESESVDSDADTSSEDSKDHVNEHETDANDDE